MGRNVKIWMGGSGRPFGGTKALSGNDNLHTVLVQTGQCTVLDPPGRHWRALPHLASCSLAVKGFSHSTCLPASRAAWAHWPCRPLGSPTYTASTEGSASSAE